MEETTNEQPTPASPSQGGQAQESAPTGEPKKSKKTWLIIAAVIIILIILAIVIF